jgi:hypothetical protein
MLACLLSLSVLNPLVLIGTESGLENQNDIKDYPKSSPPVDMTILGNISLQHNWTRQGRSGGSSDIYDAKEVYVDDDENMYMVGVLYDFQVNFYIEKYNSLGQFQWNLSWNGGLDLFITSTILSVAVNKYQEIFLTGCHRVEGSSPTSNSDVFLLKVNSVGSVDWVRTWGIGGDSDYNDIGYGVACDSSGNPFVTGIRYHSFNQKSNILLLKYDRNGNLLWDRGWNYATSSDRGNSIKIDSNDNVYITGFAGDSDMNLCLLKYNNSGDFEWSQIWNPSDDSEGTSLAIDSGDNICVIGWYSRDPGNIDTATLLKYNSSGSLSWNISMRYSDDTEFYNVIVDPFDNIYITGKGYFYNISHSFYIFKFNSSGQAENYGYSENLGSGLIDLECDAFGNIYLTGWFDYDSYKRFSLAKYYADCDNDGLFNRFEMDVSGTDPNDPDSDNDNLTDGEEYEGNIYWKYPAPTDPLDPDTDNDNLTDYEELLIYLSDPNDIDTDGDGLSDGSEVNTHGTNPIVSDSDSDGLSDGLEVNSYNTNPLSSDTDSDTMLDKWEIDNSLDPLVNDTNEDPDSDNLLNIEEFQMDCDPQDDDTDDDGWLDGDEVHIYGTDPTDPYSHPNPPSPGNIPSFSLFIIGLVSIISIIAILRKIRLKK